MGTHGRIVRLARGLASCTTGWRPPRPTVTTFLVGNFRRARHFSVQHNSLALAVSTGLRQSVLCPLKQWADPRGSGLASFGSSFPLSRVERLVEWGARQFKVKSLDGSH